MRLSDVPEEWLDCWAHMHAMKRENPPGHITYRPQWGTRVYFLECQRCGTWRVVAMDSLNNVTLSRYFPPKGYREARQQFITKGGTRAKVRGEMWRREKAERDVRKPTKRETNVVQMRRKA